MKKLYSAPIADLIDAGSDFILAGVSRLIETSDDVDGPGGFGEARPGDGEGGVFAGSMSKSTSIFDYE